MSIKDRTALKLIIFKIIKRVSSSSWVSVFCVEIPDMFEKENKEEAFTFLLRTHTSLPPYQESSLQFAIPTETAFALDAVLHVVDGRFTVHRNEYRISTHFSYRCFSISRGKHVSLPLPGF